MKISYAITCCNEFLEIQKLIPFLLENKRVQDEIVILFDQKNGDPEVLNYLLKFNKLPNVQTWRGFEFDGHFANWKNLLTTYCAGDYIVNLDADELPNELLLKNLPTILESNSDTDVYLVPRVNTVSNLGLSHVNKWGWNISKLETHIEEKEFDLDNPQDLDEYNLLKQKDLIIEETTPSK